MTETSEEHKQLAQLARQVEAVFDTDTVRERLNHVLDALLKGTQAEVGKVAREALLLYRGLISQKRDEEWARAMASIWIKDPDAQVPTNPLELQAVILGWQASRERELAKTKQAEGFKTGFATAIDKAIRLGWATAEAGKGLEDALQAGRKMVP